MPKTFSLSRWLRPRRRPIRNTPFQSRARLTEFLQLEDRTVPAVLDLTGGTTSGYLNAGFFELINQQPAGSGVIDSFVRLHDLGPGDTNTPEGHNTSGRNQGSPKLNFDENSSPVFTHDLQLKDVPVVTGADGIKYREFRLDVNDPNNSSSPRVSLNKFKVFTNSSGGILASGVDISELGALRWVMDGNIAANGTSTSGPYSGPDSDGPQSGGSPDGNWVNLYDKNHGSGQADLRVLVPESAFNGVGPNAYVYLFSRFGDTQAMTGGYEEWYVAPTEKEVGVNVVTQIHQTSPINRLGPIDGSVFNVELGSIVHDHAYVEVADDTPDDPFDGTPVTTGSVTFSFFASLDGTGDPVWTYTDTDGSDGWQTPEAGTPWADMLHAGEYSFAARYNGGSSQGTTYAAGLSENEPLRVGEGVLNLDTQVHNASHQDITNTHISLGSVVHDKAFFNPAAPSSGDFVPTGLVEYRLYKGVWQDDNGNGVADFGDTVGDTLVYTSVKNLNANGTIPESGDSPALGAGKYFYLTFFDSTNPDYVDAEGPAESFEVDKAQLRITTTVHNDAGHVVIPEGGHVSLGTAAHDTATVTGAVDGFAIGAITFTFEGNAIATSGLADLPATARSVSTGPLGANTAANPVYTFAAAVAGNDNYIGATSADENFYVDKAQLQITTEIHGPNGHDVLPINSHVPLGSVMHDTAQVTGAVAGFAIGAVSFTLNGSAVANDGKEGDLFKSANSAPLTAGNYAYRASVAGNDNYIGATSDPEPFVVDKAYTQIRTEVHNSAHKDITGDFVPSGTKVHDKAFVTSSNNSFAIGGNVRYDLYVDANGDGDGDDPGDSLYQSWTVPVGSETPDFTTQGGFWAYRARYLGDGNYNASADSAWEPFAVLTSQPGHTPGWWQNKNGQKLLTQDDFAELTALHLVDQSGSAKDFTGTLDANKSALAAWILADAGQNAAYKLSSFLATITLNINHGYNDGSGLVYCPDFIATYGASHNFTGVGPGNQFLSLDQLLALADASLASNPLTPSGSPERAYQLALAGILDQIANGAALFLL